MQIAGPKVPLWAAADLPHKGARLCGKRSAFRANCAGGLSPPPYGEGLGGDLFLHNPQKKAPLARRLSCLR